MISQEQSPTANSVEQKPQTPTIEPGASDSSFLTRLKYTLLKIIDLTALGFLEPIVRLCYKEEPHVQIKKIGQFVLIPVIFILAFLIIWDISSARIKTKTGTLPNPSEVWNSMSSIMEIDRRENEKLAAYALSGEAQTQAITHANDLVDTLDTEIESAKSILSEQEELVKDYLTKNYSASKAHIGEKKDSYRAAAKQRVTDMKAQAEQGASHDSIYRLYAEHENKTLFEREDIANQEYLFEQAQANDVTLLKLKRAEKIARLNVNALSDERMHQHKLLSILNNEGKTARLANLSSKRDDVKQELQSATGLATYNQAKSLYKFESKIEKASESSYAKSWTLPMQIWRSIVCVFSGFLFGCLSSKAIFEWRSSLIAIPVGVLCGLSKTFMAAMTPFIAIFKPVSPIVWLLIFWVVVSGFIPDPDKHWLINGLSSLPLIGWMEINPAFISSALTVAMCCLWATLVNTALGVASVDQDHLNVAKVLRLGFWNRLFKIILPSALPLIFAGMRISLGVGWMVLVAAELLAGSEGVGKFTWDMFNNNSSDSFAKIMVMVFVVGFIGLLLDRIMIIFQRLVSFEGSVAAI